MGIHNFDKILFPDPVWNDPVRSGSHFGSPKANMTDQTHHDLFKGGILFHNFLWNIEGKSQMKFLGKDFQSDLWKMWKKCEKIENNLK